MIENPRHGPLAAAALRQQAQLEVQREVRDQLIIAAAALERQVEARGRAWWWPEDD